MKNLFIRISLIFALIIFLTISLTSFQCAGRSEIEVIDLKTEYQKNPVGIDSEQPRFTWVLQSEERGQQQTAYQILVASREEFLEEDTGDMWDSKKMKSSQSVHVRYKGKSLESNRRYYVKVRAWGKNQKPGPFSQGATFTTAILHPDEWTAKWIGKKGIKDPPDDPGYYFQQTSVDIEGDPIQYNARSILLRKVVEVSKKVKHALVHVSGLGYYELSVNGKKVGDKILSPAKTYYKKIVLYDTYDLTSFLNEGKNAIGIILGNGWYNPLSKWWSWRMQWFGPKRAILQLHLTYTDGTREVIETDDTWKINDGPILSSCIYDGEIYDANQEIDAWNHAGLDDSGWQNAGIFPSPGGKMVPQLIPSIKETEIIKPQKITKPQEGVYVVDLGQNISGWVRVKVSGKKGSIVTLRYAENIKMNGMIDPKSNNLALTTDKYILSGKENETYEPRFTYHGFRYVEISGPVNPLRSEDIAGIVVHSDVEPVGTFECSNERLNKIHEVTVWSQRANLMGIPTDCPQRDERLGWIADAHVTAEEAIYNFDMALFYKKWLDDIKSTQSPENGDIPYISPRPFTDGAGTPAWSSGYHLIVWYLYQYYGDESILTAHFDAMCRYVDHLSSTAQDHILPLDNYGDWLSANRTWKRGEPLSVSTGYYFYVTSIVAKTAKVLEQKEAYDKYSLLAGKIKKAYNNKFYDYNQQQYEDGSQFSNSFPLFLGIATEFFGKAALGGLVVDILANKGHLNTGILGTKYMMEALSRENHSKMAYLMATQTDYPGWINLIQGRTTFSEHWNQTGSNNHVMFGSIDSWFYKVLAGINVDETKPGFKNIIIKPYIASEMDWVKASVKTIRGQVNVEWNKDGEDLILNIQIPANMTATVYILADDPKDVKEDGNPASSSPGITYLRMDGKYAVYQVESGWYEFNSNEISSLIDTPYASIPAISPADTSVYKPNSILVYLSTETDGAEIRYTLDNSLPSKASVLYKDPITLNNHAKINARTFKKGYHPSFVQSADIYFVDPKHNGVHYRLFEGEWTQLPDFSNISPNREGIIYTFGLDDLKLPKYEFALEISGFLNIEKEGQYSFYTSSNDGSRLYIADNLIVDNDGEHMIEEKSGTTFLRVGKHPIKVTYFQSGGGMDLEILYEGPGIEKQMISPAVLFQKR